MNIDSISSLASNDESVPQIPNPTLDEGLDVSKTIMRSEAYEFLSTQNYDSRESIRTAYATLNLIDYDHSKKHTPGGKEYMSFAKPTDNEDPKQECQLQIAELPDHSAWAYRLIGNDKSKKAEIFEDDDNGTFEILFVPREFATDPEKLFRLSMAARYGSNVDWAKDAKRNVGNMGSPNVGDFAATWREHKGSGSAHIKYRYPLSMPDKNPRHTYEMNFLQASSYTVGGVKYDSFARIQDPEGQDKVFYTPEPTIIGYKFPRKYASFNGN